MKIHPQTVEIRQEIPDSTQLYGCDRRDCVLKLPVVRLLQALGADLNEVHRTTPSRKGYWRMSQNEIVRFALNNRWLEEQGVPDLRAIWIVLHYGPQARV